MATCRKTAAAGIAAAMERMPLYIFSTINAEQQQRKQKIAEGQPLGRKHKVHVKVGDNDVSNHDNLMPSPCFPWV